MGIQQVVYGLTHSTNYQGTGYNWPRQRPLMWSGRFGGRLLWNKIEGCLIIAKLNFING